MIPAAGAAWAIRPAVAADLSVIPDIETAAATLFPPGRLPADDEPHAPAELEAYLASGRLWVAASPAGVLGFLAARDLDRALHVDEVDVHPSCARRGIGAALVRHALAQAAAAGWQRVTLTTFDDLPWNGPFYQRLGFRTLGDAELTPALRALLAAERARGMVRRIAMAAPAEDVR